MTPPTELMSMEEAALDFPWTARQLYRYARKGELPFVVRLGNRYLVSRNAFTRWKDTAGGQFMADREIGSAENG
jgi:hypothetical protein